VQTTLLKWCELQYVSALTGRIGAGEDTNRRCVNDRIVD
jgi:hypothetical protein